jgi:hypothetical protein
VDNPQLRANASTYTVVVPFPLLPPIWIRPPSGTRHTPRAIRSRIPSSDHRGFSVRLRS